MEERDVVEQQFEEGLRENEDREWDENDNPQPPVAEDLSEDVLEEEQNQDGPNGEVTPASTGNFAASGSTESGSNIYFTYESGTDQHTVNGGYQWGSVGLSWYTIKYWIKRQFRLPTFSRPFKKWMKKRKEIERKKKEGWDG